VFGKKPIAAPYKAKFMECLQIEKKSPAFLTNLDTRGEAERHRLIYPAYAVDVEFLDHNFLNNLRFFRRLVFAGVVYGSFFFHI